MTEREETWKKFTIICNTCGRHEDEGVYLDADYDGKITIRCPCGQEETD